MKWIFQYIFKEFVLLDNKEQIEKYLTLLDMANQEEITNHLHIRKLFNKVYLTIDLDYFDNNLPKVMKYLRLIKKD